MIVANLATFPPRAKKLQEVISRLLPQVDTINVVFNEYDRVPAEYVKKTSLNPIIPSSDTKDTGKFLPSVSKNDYVFLVDDDIEYPSNYVEIMLEKFHEVPKNNFVAGLFSSIYEKPKILPKLRDIRRFTSFHIFPRKIARYRRVLSFNQQVDAPIFVDQLGTGTAVLRGQNMPPYDYMEGSQNFVDVRFARWCFEQDISMVALPREVQWISWEDDEYSIYNNFTVTHPVHVSKEIWSYAFKRPYIGQGVASDLSRQTHDDKLEHKKT